MPSPTIMGLSGSNVNWEKMLEKMMQAYEKRLEVHKLSEFEANQQVAAWKMLRQKLQDLRSASRYLYDPIRNPFSSMKNESSDPRAFTVTTDRTAKSGKHKIEVLEVASADIFQSDPLKHTAVLEAGKFTVSSNNDKFTINFNGGTINTLETILNRVAGKILNARVMNIDGENVAMIIEGKNTGVKNRIKFEDESGLLKKIGLLELRSAEQITVNFSNQSLFRTRQGNVNFINDSIVLTPKSLSDYALNNEVKILQTHKIEFEYRILVLTDNNATPINRTIAQNGAIQSIDAARVTVGTIDQVEVGPYRIHGNHLQAALTEAQRRELEQRQQQEREQAQREQEQRQRAQEQFDNGIIFLQNGGEIIKTISVENVNQWKKVELSLSDINGKSIDRIIFKNNNNYKTVEVRKMILSDGREALGPKNYISQAKDAVVKYNGIKVTRDSNSIDKLIPGATINLKRRTNGEETLTMDYDYDTIAKVVEEFIIHYNNTMDFIFNVTKHMPRKELRDRLEAKKRIENMPEDQKNNLSVSGKLFEGVLSGDVTISSIKRKLREVMMNPYPTPAGPNIRFFIQIGLQNPTFSSNASADEQKNMRAGYFEFKKDKFIEMLQKNFESVRDFFASDTNGDLIKNDGLSVKFNQSLQFIAAVNYRGEDGRVHPSLLENRIAVADNYFKGRQKNTKNFEKQMEMRRKRMIDQIRRAEQAEARASAIRQRLGAFDNNPGGRR